MGKKGKGGKQKGGGSGRNRGLRSEAHQWLEKAVQACRGLDDTMITTRLDLLKGLIGRGLWQPAIGDAKSLIEIAGAMEPEEAPKQKPKKKFGPPEWKLKSLGKLEAEADDLGVERPEPNPKLKGKEAEADVERRFHASIVDALRQEVNNLSAFLDEAKAAKKRGQAKIDTDSTIGMLRKRLRKVEKLIRGVRNSEKLDNAYGLRRKAVSILKAHRLPTKDLLGGLMKLHQRRVKPIAKMGGCGNCNRFDSCQNVDGKLEGRCGQWGASHEVPLIDFEFILEVQWAINYLATKTAKKIGQKVKGRPQKKVGRTHIDIDLLVEKRIEEAGAFTFRDVAAIMTPWMDVEREEAKILYGEEPSEDYLRVKRVVEARGVLLSESRTTSFHNRGGSTDNWHTEWMRRVAKVEAELAERKAKKAKKAAEKEAALDAVEQKAAEEATLAIMAGDEDAEDDLPKVRPKRRRETSGIPEVGKLIGTYPRRSNQSDAEINPVMVLQKAGKWRSRYGRHGLQDLIEQ